MNKWILEIIKNFLISVLYVVIVMVFLMFINASFDDSLDDYGYYQIDRDYITKLEEDKLNDYIK